MVPRAGLGVGTAVRVFVHIQEDKPAGDQAVEQGGQRVAKLARPRDPLGCSVGVRKIPVAVAARDLASGRVFKQICGEACRTAFLRDVRRHDPGLRVEDMENAVTSAMERLRSTLTPANARVYLSDLPQDVDVVSVDLPAHKAARVHYYINAA